MQDQSTEAKKIQVHRIRNGKINNILIPINVLRYTFRDRNLDLLRDHLGSDVVEAITEPRV